MLNKEKDDLYCHLSLVTCHISMHFNCFSVSGPWFVSVDTIRQIISRAYPFWNAFQPRSGFAMFLNNTTDLSTWAI